MTPGARIAAAIDILDDILTGTAAEKALTSWARRSRFAGSKDRAAVRNHVFDAVRNMRSYAEIGSGAWPATARAIMLGAVRSADLTEADLFNGVGHAPAVLQEHETEIGTVSENGAWNLPDDLIALLKTEVGATARDQALALGARAPVTLRANLAKTNRSDLQTLLAKDGIETSPNPLCDTALTVIGSERGLTAHRCFQDGLFEMQDAGSQALVSDLPVSADTRVLDYCAGYFGSDFSRFRSIPRTNSCRI